MAVRIVDVADEVSFALLPPCADPAFDHRTCDYWEDAERGSKRARVSSTAQAASATASAATAAPRPRADPFGEGPSLRPSFNPFAPAVERAPTSNPFAAPGDADPLVDNPFAPRRAPARGPAPDAPRKLALLGRGAAVFGSYAKVLLVDDVPLAYAQFGPLSAYPRAARVRELYRQLPDAPLPAVITCVASTADGRHAGHARLLVEAVCADLAGRGFAAVEAYPEIGARPEATSAATAAFWLDVGFTLAVDDPHFPVVRREL
ncbi:MAG: hypothetical protein ACYDAK_09605 [Candidatus Limnocylindrales bacterium]